jgi:hypothetical protein
MKPESTHEPKLIKDPKSGKERFVYVRSKETIEALEKDRLGKLHMLKPITNPELTERLNQKFLVVITPYITAQRVVLTRLLSDRTIHKLVNGTQLLESYLRSESYLEGFPQFNQLFIQFSYSEAPNRRLADIINEIVGLRYHLDKHCWLMIPKNLTELASQWGESLLNMTYLPTCLLPPQSGEGAGPITTAKTDHTPKVGREQFNSNPETKNLTDLKFAKKGKRRKWTEMD